MTNTREVKCPQCGLLAFYTPENPYRPFCSERCRLIDLGEWASGNYTIPVSKDSELYVDLEDEKGDSEGSEPQS
ncbi:MAG: DNA gyrase inhibitor YacG [Bdellovibrio sp.]|nr:DNA gyrase inhibitor YacG [Bdellovibrio sp.]